MTHQTHNLPTQALTTLDGKRVVVSGIVVYRIKDIVATLARNWDISETLNDLTMVAIKQVVTTKLEYLLAKLTDEVREADQGDAQELPRLWRERLLDGPDRVRGVRGNQEHHGQRQPQRTDTKWLIFRACRFEQRCGPLAVAKWVKAGRPVRSDDEVERIFRTHCRPCSRFVPQSRVCRICGCYLDGDTPVTNKIKMATEHCGRYKW